MTTQTEAANLGRDRFRGALVGLAVGDALGTTLEFKPPGTFKPISDMTGGGPFGLAPGKWTDDTSLALCLADSLVQRQGRSFPKIRSSDTPAGATRVFGAAPAIASTSATRLAPRSTSSS